MKWVDCIKEAISVSSRGAEQGWRAQGVADGITYSWCGQEPESTQGHITTAITLILNMDKSSARKENYKPISLMNIDAKIRKHSQTARSSVLKIKVHAAKQGLSQNPGVSPH